MIKVNDREMDFSGTIKELLISLSLNPDTCAVLINGEIVRKEKWDNVMPKDGDSVEVVSFVGGG